LLPISFQNITINVLWTSITNHWLNKERRLRAYLNLSVTLHVYTQPQTTRNRSTHFQTFYISVSVPTRSTHIITFMHTDYTIHKLYTHTTRVNPPLHLIHIIDKLYPDTTPHRSYIQLVIDNYLGTRITIANVIIDKYCYMYEVPLVQ
jgi:hypothetical protein